MAQGDGEEGTCLGSISPRSSCRFYFLLAPAGHRHGPDMALEYAANQRDATRLADSISAFSFAPMGASDVSELVLKFFVADLLSGWDPSRRMDEIYLARVAPMPREQGADLDQHLPANKSKSAKLPLTR